MSNRLSVVITACAPLLSRTSNVMSIGVDAEPLTYQNKPVIPGSQIRGNLRHAWTELNNHGANIPVDEWLGRPSENKNSQSGFEPTRSKLLFAHLFEIQGENKDMKDHIRIAIDNDTGVVKPHALQIVRSLWTYGSELCVTGWIEYPDDIDSKELQQSVLAGLKWMGALGSEKGVGYGVIKDVLVATDKTNTQSAKSAQKTEIPIDINDSIAWQLGLSFDRPFCFAEAHGTTANRLVSVNHVPGASVVAQIARAGILKPDELEQLTVGHGQLGGFLQAIPHCWVMGNHDDAALLADASLHPRPFVFSHDDHGVLAPQFSHDWKSFPVHIKESQGELLPDPGWLEVHTAIQKGTRQADESQLFSLVCMDSIVDNQAGRWLFNIHVASLSDTGKTALRGFLLEELTGPFGKTDAIVTDVSLEPASPAPWVFTDSGVRLMLQSDACLLDRSTNTGSDGLLAYASYWLEISNGVLQLQQQFIREKLAGGLYIHRRFETQSPYQPDILTNAGSVFVLSCSDQDNGRILLDKWSLEGLPEASHYRHLPFNKRPWSPRNGFGAIGPLPELNSSLPTGWGIEYV